MFKCAQRSFKAPLSFVIDEIVDRWNDDREVWFEQLDMEEQRYAVKTLIDDGDCMGDLLSDMHDNEQIHELATMLQLACHQRYTNPPIGEEILEEVCFADVLEIWEVMLFKIAGKYINEAIDIESNIRKDFEPEQLEE